MSSLKPDTCWWVFLTRASSARFSYVLCGPGPWQQKNNIQVSYRPTKNTFLGQWKLHYVLWEQGISVQSTVQYVLIVWWGQPASVQMLGVAPVDLGVAVLLLRWKWSRMQSCFDLKYYCHTCVWWWMNLYSSHSVLNLNCVKVYNLAEFKVIIFILFLNAGKVWPIIMYRWKIEEFTADVWLLMKCWFKNCVFCSMVDWHTFKIKNSRAKIEIKMQEVIEAWH